MQDLRTLQAVKLNVGEEQFILRTELKGHAYDVFKAIGCRSPNRIMEHNVSGK
ncbi:hypothetical protein IT084_07310 [Desulfallas sp. Bu1-1]|uniref:hypothetical protein n=1 Tax=Desulfallas sp. Bu1-1 TaxID=2787620 RepID=UPI0018A0C611|nr:hypothetical protein [Desulfallas sp. Bu1-1]MBF7082787.1 hypothetical protein [Desulfallas sp. Bu1-1]